MTDRKMAEKKMHVQQNEISFGSPHVLFYHFLFYPSWFRPQAGLGNLRLLQVACIS